MKRPRALKTWIFLAALALGGGWFFFLRPKDSSADAGASRFQTMPVEKGRITAKVTATGTLSATVTVQVGSQVSGRLSAIKVDYNSPVNKGDVLATLDPELFNAALARARADAVAAKGNLKKARVQADEAERQLSRTQALAAKQFVSQADLDAARANAEVARATAEAAVGAVAQADAGLRTAAVNLAYTTIKSPIDGTVISKNVDEGQTVAASFQAPVLFVLAEDLHHMQVDTSVAEADVGKLAKDMTATFTVDAWPGEKFTGSVRQIRNAAQTVQNVVTYDAVIRVENDADKLRPGMTANVSFITGEKTDVVKVPNAALRFRPPPAMFEGPGAPTQPASLPPDSGKRAAWALRDNKPVSVILTPGLTDGTTTEQIDGDVQVGDTLIIDMTQSPFAGRKGGMRLF